ncbi:hypothetical protein ONS95_006061 [Cadophora gregata]|uniref:uncharacterized protein n=1 Tax=Cadophora gregata TaxID=51156 RepID=UPI0026DDB44E|nr:uncharacterized protein ONS95_006061 [Cadophora gregata]KAK0102442.1 hypothetical protein ONS95_006061 [Cadophora gregata]KAK0104069.1 hypothetical protein ONS96_005171 [Cadophora gregata f. sp. sojae]
MVEHDMMSGPPSAEGENLNRRKRVRKGTRSCWECKRRKVRCQLSSEDVPVCSGCLSRGTTCLSQEYPEEREPSNHGNQVGERLGRMEALLETLLAKVSAYEEEEEAQKMMTPESIGNDVLSPFATSGSDATSSTPLITIFDSPILGRRDNSVSHTPASQSTKSSSCRPPKDERIRQILLDLLPPQHETNSIVRSSSSWFLVHALENRATSKCDSVSSATSKLSELSRAHPTKIARTLMFIAVCLQQLDPEFDKSKLHLFPTVEARMEKMIITVQGLITSDDELVSTVNGLETLVLLGAFHINAGNPRRAWMTFRRAMNIGQLMGIHKPETSIEGGWDMWLQMTQGDRYLSLLLGLPAGANDPIYKPDETFDNPATDKDCLFTRKMCDLSSRIIERNEASGTHAYATTQEIDEGLDRLAKEMPASWWAIPDIVENDRSHGAALTFDRLMAQVWFFQLEALLHLPFMLKSERRFEYSKFSCLKASREVLWRYLALRSAENKSFCCKIIDFGALTASVTLFLGLLEPVTGIESPERKSDRNLIQTVLESMEELSQGGKDVVATQSVNVIKSLLAIDDASGRNTGNLKLTIPYFGTISIIRPHKISQGSLSAPQYIPQQQPPNEEGQINPQHQLQTLTINQNSAQQNWATQNFVPMTSSQQNPMNLPHVSFTSSQFPEVGPEQQIEDWGLPVEMDTLFFDSLLNTDIEGNWIF